MNVVYTALFGRYDTLLPPLVIDPEWEYVVFADHAFDAPAPWKLQVVHPFPDPRYGSRAYFTQSTVVLPDAEYTVMHGANAQLTCSPSLLLSFLGKNDIAAFKHPHRESVYDEPAVCAMLNMDTMAVMQPQVQRYRDEGFSGTPFSACILLVRHNTPALNEFENLWWSEVYGGSCRDQLSFDYCRWKLGIPISYIPGNCFKNEFIIYHGHNTK